MWVILAGTRGNSMSYGKILGSFSEKGILYRIYQDSVTVSKKVVFFKKKLQEGDTAGWLYIWTMLGILCYIWTVNLYPCEIPLYFQKVKGRQYRILWGCSGHSLWKTIWQFIMKLITLLAPDLTILFGGKGENVCPHSNLCGNFYRSFLLCS